MEISISLSSDFDKFIKEQMETGLYNSVNDIIQEAMTLLVERKAVQQEELTALIAELEKGEEDIKAGRYSDADEFFQELISEYE